MKIYNFIEIKIIKNFITLCKLNQQELNVQFLLVFIFDDKVEIVVNHILVDQS